MNNSIYKIVDGLRYKKSLSSKDNGKWCVGVAYQNGTVHVLNMKNTNTKIQFTLEEWTAFIEGAKRGEFDPNSLG